MKKLVRILRRILGREEAAETLWAISPGVHQKSTEGLSVLGGLPYDEFVVGEFGNDVTWTPDGVQVWIRVSIDTGNLWLDDAFKGNIQRDLVEVVPLKRGKNWKLLRLKGENWLPPF